ncbi:MAG TPA: iron-sulfur cluster biosynthesis family protein [Beutenbergiaceae bacterium]|nr:iron-sulfur cluster biosynthesis family protein [Beutenbergiaceae bacterium]
MRVASSWALSVTAEEVFESTMLTLTDDAQTAIQAITADAGLPEGGGVRIALADGGTELQMQLVPEPAEGDEVIEAGGARVFASEDASVMLSEQQLDAGQTDEGTGFSLRPQD